MSRRRQEKSIDIYEKLDPDSCLIISRTSEDVLVACNKDGEITIKRIAIPKKEK